MGGIIAGQASETPSLFSRKHDAELFDPTVHGQTGNQQNHSVGNRLASSGSAGNATYTPNATNQYSAISGVSPVGYSGRGDLTQYGAWTYVYDAMGNLIQAQNPGSGLTAKYARDGFGQRAVKDANGAKTVFFNLGTLQLEARDVAAGTATSTIYEPGIDRPLAEIGNSGAVAFFYHQDWLGNVAVLTNPGGTVHQTYTYDVWGTPSGFDASGLSLPVSAFSSRFLFTAREFNAETGLYHYRARAYGPLIGRFLQSDPIDFAAGDVNQKNPTPFVL